MSQAMPKRPREHVLEELSIDHVRSILPAEWVRSTVHADYGLGIRVEIVAEGKMAGRE